MKAELEKFTIRLNNIEDSYYGFVVAVLNYVQRKSERLDVVEAFLNANPAASTSEILEFISNQKDFFEDAAYAIQVS